MRKAYLMYFLMFAAAIGGLWVILTMGAAVRAPDDLSGDWNILWASPPPKHFDGSIMRISQSGRYFTVRFGSAEPVSFTLDPVWRGVRDGRTLQMELRGQNWKLLVSGAIPLGPSPKVGELSLVLSGESTHVAVARRVGFQPTTRAAGVAHAR